MGEAGSSVLSGKQSAAQNMAGAVANVGDASSWMMASPQRTRTDTMAGTVPGFPFGCLLLTGQEGRTSHRDVSGAFDTSVFSSSFLQDEVLSLQDGTMTPPAFLVSLVSFLQSGLFRSNSPKSSASTDSEVSDDGMLLCT